MSAYRPCLRSVSTQCVPRVKNKYTVSILKDYDTFGFHHLHFSGPWNGSSHSCFTCGWVSVVQRFPVLRQGSTLGGTDHPTGSDKNVARLARISLALEIRLVFGRGENVPFHSPCNHTIPSNRFQQGFSTQPPPPPLPASVVVYYCSKWQSAESEGGGHWKQSSSNSSTPTVTPREKALRAAS